jgi:hypothetical protein
MKKMLRELILQDLFYDPLIAFDQFEELFYKIDARMEAMFLHESDSPVKLNKLLNRMCTWQFTVYYNIIFASCVGWIPSNVARDWVTMCLGDPSVKSEEDFVKRFKYFMEKRFMVPPKELESFKCLTDIIDRDIILYLNKKIFSKYPDSMEIKKTEVKEANSVHKVLSAVVII